MGTRNTREERSRTTSERSDDSRENNRQKEAPEKSDRHAAPAAKSNPFGNAKPVDRSEIAPVRLADTKPVDRSERSADDSRENRDSRDNRDSRQIDEEPKSDRPAPPSDDSRENNRQKEAPEKSDRPAAPAAKSNPFGNAKPVNRSERPERS